MTNDLKYSAPARNEMYNGIIKLYDAVRVTLGPKGRNVIIDQEFGPPLIINDGVTIAKNINLPNKYENLATKLLIDSATKTNDLVGDGTTSTIVLATNFIKEGLKHLEKGVNPIEIKEGLNYYLKQIIEKIKEVSLKINSIEDYKQIASISSGSEFVGEIIKQAYELVGETGLITIEESSLNETTLEVVKGYSYDKGFVSPYMATSKEKQEAVLEEPLVLITNAKITDINELVHILEHAIEVKRSLFSICEDIDQSVLSALVINKLRGVVNAVVTKAPGFSQKRKNILNDLCCLTNSKLIDVTLGNKLKDLKVSDLGTCQKIKVSNNQTIIIGDKTVEIDDYVNSLKQILRSNLTNYEQNSLSERIAKLQGGVALIRVGANTEVELGELKLRTEDALNACIATKEYGTIEGAGKVAYEISDCLEKVDKYQASYDILSKSLKSLFIQIVENAGCNYQQILDKLTDNLWFDAKTLKIVNLRRAGIIDPASVLINALKSSISIAGMFLTTECAIVRNEEQKIINEENML